MEAFEYSLIDPKIAPMNHEVVIVYRIQIYSEYCKEWQQSFYDDIEVLEDTEEAKLSALQWLEKIKQVRSNYDWRFVKMVTTCEVVNE